MIEPWRKALAALAGILAVPAMGLAQPAPPDTLTETYRDWTLRCQNTAGDEVLLRSCELVLELRSGETGQRVLAVVFSPDASGEFGLTMIIPFGLAVLEGVTLLADDSEISHLPIQTCRPAGCFANAPASIEIQAAFRSHERAVARMWTLEGQPFEVGFSLAGFGAAWDRIQEF